MIKLIIVLGMFYVIIGYAVEYGNALGRGDTLKFNFALFKKALRWPKTVFGK